MSPLRRALPAAPLFAMLLAGCATGACWPAKDAVTSGEAAAEAPADAWPAMPEPGPAPSFEVPASERFELSNGVPVVYVRASRVPITHLELFVRAGVADEPADQLGLAALTADLMNEGAGDRDALAISEALQLLASGISVGAGTEYSSAQLDSLDDNFEATLDLFADIVLRPTFLKADLDRVRDDRKNRILTERDDLQTTGGKIFNRVLYGDSWYGRWSAGTAESLDRVTRESVVAWHRAAWQPGHAGFVVVTGMDREAVKQALEARFGSWKAGKKARPPEPRAVQIVRHEGVRIYWHDKPGASQTAIHLGNTAPAWEAELGTRSAVANLVLGGQFTSRINMNLREDKAYTYGARTSVRLGGRGGLWLGSSSVKAGTTALSLVEFMNELNGVRGDRPLTDEEVGRAASGMLQGQPSRFERAGSILEQFTTVEALSRPEGWLAGYRARVEAVTLADAQAALDSIVDPLHLAIVLIGDRNAPAQAADGSTRDGVTIGQAVEELGLGPITWVDSEGSPVQETTK